MKPASEKRTRAWTETRFSNFQLANSGYNNNGIKYTSKMLKNDVEVMLALSLVGKLPDRNLTIFAIKPDSARKFD